MYISGMDFLKVSDTENEMDSAKSSLAINGNSLCLDPSFVQSLCNVFPMNLIKTVRYGLHYQMQMGSRGIIRKHENKKT